MRMAEQNLPSKTYVHSEESECHTVALYVFVSALNGSRVRRGPRSAGPVQGCDMRCVCVAAARCVWRIPRANRAREASQGTGHGVAPRHARAVPTSVPAVAHCGSAAGRLLFQCLKRVSNPKERLAASLVVGTVRRLSAPQPTVPWPKLHAADLTHENLRFAIASCPSACQHAEISCRTPQSLPET